MEASRAFRVMVGVVALGLLAGCASTTGTSNAGQGGGDQGTASAQSVVTGTAGTTPHATAGGGSTSAATRTSAPEATTSTTAVSNGATKPSTSSSYAGPLTACGSSVPDNTPVPGSTLPRTTGQDVQCLVDPLDAVKTTDPTTTVRFSRMADPSTASRGLRSWILSPYTPNLAAFDQAAYGVHGDLGPSLLVAVATPTKLNGIGAHYPDFVGGVLRAAGASDLYSPATTGVHASTYGLVITCGHETLHGRTVCVWMGTQPDMPKMPLVGVLVILAIVPTAKAEAEAEAVFAAIAP
jgi:hypothetical protein